MDQQENKFGMREGFGLFYALCKIHAYCFWPIIRRDFGTDALGFPAFFAMFLILFVGGLGRIPELFPYLGIWLLALACQRVRTLWLRKQGAVWHSRYEGYPWLALSLLRNGKEWQAKLLIEPVLCLLAGVVLYQFYPALGSFVMAGFVSMAMLEAINRELDRRRLAAMRDAEIEQRWLGARYRGQAGG
jgi:hypothetical protein